MNSFDDVQNRIDQYKKLYSSNTPGSLIIVNYWGGKQIPSPDLRDFDFSSMEGHKRYWRRLVENQFEIIDNRRELEDDWIPGISLHYGFGVFGTVFCDTELTFTVDTAFMEPVMDDIENLGMFSYSKDRFWSKVFEEAAEYLQDKAQDKFMVDVYPNPCPLDVVNLLRGNNLFTDFFEYPEQLKRLLSHATGEMLKHIKDVKKFSRAPWGGVYAYSRWIPGGAIILEDAADLCSPEIHREFGLPYTKQVINEVKGAYLHHHSIGRHQYGNMASLPNLYVHQISTDPNGIRPAADLEYVLRESGKVICDIECMPEEVYKYMDNFKKGRFIICVHSSDLEEAKDLIRFVRKNSAL